MNELPRRHLSLPVWHQTRPSNALLRFEDPATYDGRHHRAGGSGAWYASLTERGAWAELFRHWSDDNRLDGCSATTRSHARAEHVIVDLKGHAGLAHLPSGRLAAFSPHG